MLNLRKNAVLTLVTLVIFSLGNSLPAHADFDYFYLSCVNATNPDNVYTSSLDWKPAHALPSVTSATWIRSNGTADFNNDSIWFYTGATVHSKADILLQGNGVPLTFPTMSLDVPSLDNDHEVVFTRVDSAEKYCEQLIKLCTNEYGPDYRYLAAGIAYTYGITMYQDKELYTCPNWRINRSKLNEPKDNELEEPQLTSRYKNAYTGTYTGTYDVSCQNTERPKTTFTFIVTDEALAWTNNSGHTYKVFDMEDKSDIPYWVHYYVSTLFTSGLDKYVGGPYCAGG